MGIDVTHEAAVAPRRRLAAHDQSGRSHGSRVSDVTRRADVGPSRLLVRR